MEKISSLFMFLLIGEVRLCIYAKTTMMMSSCVDDFFNDCCLEWSERIDAGHVRLSERYLALSFFPGTLLQHHRVCNNLLFAFLLFRHCWVILL